jgi:hypothetical protein
VERADARPNLVVVSREGDPRSAVAAVVFTGDNAYASTALAALVEARLQKGGFASVDSRAARDSFRVRTLIETPARAVEFLAAVQKALAAPVVAGAPEMALIARRLASLKRHPLEAPIVSQITRCTGELGVLAGDPALDPSSSGGVAQLDALRAAAFGSPRVAFGTVGSAALTQGVAEAWRGGEKWPKGSPLETASSTNDQVGVFASSDRAGTARVTLAFPTRRAETAVRAASEAGGTDAALTTRLRALTVPFRVVEASGTVRREGGCLAVTLEMARPGAANNIEDAAAIAASVARQELDRLRSFPDDEPAREASPQAQLGFEGSRAVRVASDPREAAELAALWSLTTPAPPSAKDTATIALAVAPPSVDPHEAGTDLAAQLQGISTRFSSALDRSKKAWNAPLLERRDRVERGQGELWVLLASPCGTLAEGEADAGATALALMTALATRNREAHGVTLEPWIAADGVGIMAHAARLPGESTSAMSARVAEEAARTLTAAPFSIGAFSVARAALLNRVGEGIAPEGRALAALAGAFAPGHPSWLAPLGSWEDLAKSGTEAASLRWGALVQGPLRLAVLGNENAQQADAVARTIDRWLVRSSDQPRVCAAAEPAATAKSGTLQITLASPPPLAQALVGLPLGAEASADSAFAELTLAGLSGADGWLNKALGSLGATAQARLVGGPHAAALVIDVRASESNLDAAVAQVRGLLQRLRQGAILQNDFDRSLALRDRWDLEASLDPRRRLVDLWRDARSTSRGAPLSPESWRAWAAGALKDEKLMVVLAKPKRANP